MKVNHARRRALVVIAAAMGTVAGGALADGTQMLNPPSIPIEQGSDIIMAGVGLLDGQPDTIDFDVPAGVDIVQVIMYWEGQEVDKFTHGEMDTINVNGSDITGMRIGGPVPVTDTFWTSSYREDITGLGLVVSGPNSLSVSGLDFGQRNNGAGVLVIVDDGVNTADLQLFDGNDYAFTECQCPDDDEFDVVEPVTFMFDTGKKDRTAQVSLFVSSVALEDPTGAEGRPSIVSFAIDDVLVEEIYDQLNNADGAEWDTLIHEITIPAGAESLTVQLHSRDSGLGPFAGNLPASMVWVNGSFAMLSPDDPPGGGGCTPGYWRQPHHFDDWTAPYTPDTPFSDVFDDNAFPGMTLHNVVSQGGGHLKALGRHTVAALLNAASDEVGYGMTVQEVIDAFNDVHPGDNSDYEALKNVFENLNELGCPLGGGDINGDGTVGPADLVMLLDHWGMLKSPYDQNDDYVIDSIDLALMLAEWTVPGFD